jgi:microcystin-dependent protein
MATPFLGEIRMWAGSGNTAPNGFAFCNGQLLPVGQNQALFALLGTAYGGDGINTFGLPDLRGRVPVGVGNGHTVAEAGGQQAHTLTIAELPQHAHQLMASNTQADTVVANGNVLAVSQGLIYLNPNQVSPALTTLNPNSVTSVGGSQPHNNMQPFLTVAFIIALQGIFPS